MPAFVPPDVRYAHTVEEKQNLRTWKYLWIFKKAFVVGRLDILGLQTFQSTLEAQCDDISKNLLLEVNNTAMSHFDATAKLVVDHFSNKIKKLRRELAEVKKMRGEKYTGDVVVVLARSRVLFQGLLTELHVLYLKAKNNDISRYQLHGYEYEEARARVGGTV